MGGRHDDDVPARADHGGHALDLRAIVLDVLEDVDVERRVERVARGQAVAATAEHPAAFGEAAARDFCLDLRGQRVVGLEAEPEVFGPTAQDLRRPADPRSNLHHPAAEEGRDALPVVALPARRAGEEIELRSDVSRLFHRHHAGILARDTLHAAGVALATGDQMKALKRAVKAVLRRRGLVIAPADEYEERLAPVRDEWFRRLGIRSVIDVGANDGGFARRVRRLLPEAVLHCFEPLPAPYDALAARFAADPNFRGHRMAVGATEGRVRFHANEYSGSSSLLPMAELHRAAYPYTARAAEIEVEATTLDRHFAAIPLVPSVLLKMDVQGGEALVLEGGTSTLERVDAVFSELSFFELYGDQALASAVVGRLGDAGFTLAGIENVSRSLVDGRFLQCDAWFLSPAARARLSTHP